MNKQNRFFRHKGLAGALAMVAVILLWPLLRAIICLMRQLKKERKPQP